MDTHIKPLDRYYDFHPEEIEGAELSQTHIHTVIISYLMDVLRWLYYGQNVTVVNEVNLYLNKGNNSVINEAGAIGGDSTNGHGKAKNKRKSRCRLCQI